MTKVRTDDASLGLTYKFLGDADSGFRPEWTFTQWGAAVLAAMVAPFLLWQFLSPWPIAGVLGGVVAAGLAGWAATRAVAFVEDPRAPLRYRLRVLTREVFAPRPDPQPQVSVTYLAARALAGSEDPHDRHDQNGDTP